MRPRELRAILTFPTTTDAIAMERYCSSQGIAGRLIPVPSAISAGCGMCWSAPVKAGAGLREAAAVAGVRTEGYYELVI